MRLRLEVACGVTVNRAGSLVALASLLVVSYNRQHQSDGEQLARTYCAACHAFPEPQLLDKKTWASGVLPQMALRLGITTGSLYDEISRDPNMVVLPTRVPEPDWEKIVAYYRQTAPDSLPYQKLPAEPQIDPPFFRTAAFAPGIQSSAIITLLKIDSTHRRIFVGEAGTNTLRVFDWNRRLLSSLTLGSPPTDLVVDGSDVLVLEPGTTDMATTRPPRASWRASPRSMARCISRCTISTATAPWTSST